MIVEDGYVTYQGSSCFASCLRNYLRYKKIVLSEPDIVFNEKSVLKFGFYEHNNKSLLLLEGNLNTATNFFIKTAEVESLHTTFDNEHDAKTFLNQEINENGMITLIVYAEYLKYNKVYKYSLGVNHCINIIGQDEDNFFIDDSFVPTSPGSTHFGYVPKDMIYAAWEKAHFEYFLWNFNHIRKDLFCSKDYSITNIGTFLEKHLAGGHDEKFSYGVDAIDKLSQYLKVNVDVSNEESTDRMMEINYNIRVNGLFAAREGLIGFLEKMLDSKNSDVIGAFIAELKTVLERWDKFSYKLVRAGISKNSKYLEKCCLDLGEISSNEKQLFSQILSFLKKEKLHGEDVLR